MARKVIRHCYACGKEYTYCPSCSEDKDKPIWMFSFDTEKCRNLFQLTSDYLAGNMTKNDVIKELEEYDFTDKVKYESSIMKMISECKKENKENIEKTEEIKKISPVRKTK